MQSGEAAQALAELETIRDRTRAKLRDFWFPLTVFGALMLASVPLMAAFGGSALGPYWILAGPLGGMALNRYYRRKSLDLGLEGEFVPYAVIGIGIFLGCMLTGSLGGALGADVVAVAGPPLVISTGLLAFAWLDRSVGEAVVALVLAAFTLALVTSELDLERVSIVVTLAYGAVWFAAGLFYRKLQY